MPNSITDRLVQLQHAVDLPRVLGREEVRRPGVHARDSSNHRIPVEERVTRKNLECRATSTDPSGGPQMNEARASNLPRLYLSFNRTPDGVNKGRTDDQSASIDQAPLRISHFECIHDIDLQGADEAPIYRSGAEHENEENDDGGFRPGGSSSFRFLRLSSFHKLTPDDKDI